MLRTSLTHWMTRQLSRWERVPGRGVDSARALGRQALHVAGQLLGWVQAGVPTRAETLHVLNATTGAHVLTATARVWPQGRRVVVNLGEFEASTRDLQEAVSSLLDRCESLALRMNALRVEVDVPYEDLELRSMHERCGYRAGMTLMTPDGEIYCRHWRPVGGGLVASAASRRLDWAAVLRRR